MERGGAVRIRDANGREISFNSWGESQPPRGPGGQGKGKNKGKSKASQVPGSDVFRCKPCLKDCSGEISLAQHCQGKAHASQAGHYGFAGLVPNGYGIVPPLSPGFLQSNPHSQAPSSGGASSGGKSKAPAVQKVEMSMRNEAAVRAALHRSASVGSLANGVGDAPTGGGYAPSLGPAMHKCLSEGRLQPPEGQRFAGQMSNLGGVGAKGAGLPLSGDDPRAQTHSPFWCEICKQDLESEKSLKQHLRGKKHSDRERKVKKEQRLPPKGRAPSPPLPPGIVPGGNHQPIGSPRQAPAQGIYRPPKARAPDSGLPAPPPPPQEVERPPPSDAAKPPTGRPPSQGRARPRTSGNRAPMPSAPPPSLVDLGPMTKQREGLPAAAYRATIIDILESNQVLVVEGETGCGKTTQVPQFVLEDAAKRGVSANIICTQPRRISAMGVAERIANERGEPIGSTVGYTIRLESRVSSSTHLLFCTTGILLRRLEDDPDLEGVTHVFVDEVHERSIESDFLLMVLRDLLKRNKKLRLTLMSATLDVDLFGRYFDGAPSLSIPGRTFPVATMWLEDALELTRHIVKPNADWARKGDGGKANRKAKYGGGGGICQDYQQGRCSRGAACRFSHGSDASSVSGLAGGARPGYDSAPASDSNFNFKSGGVGTGSYFQNALIPGMADRQQYSPAPGEALDDAELSEEELRARYPRYAPGVSTAISKLDPNAINYELIVQILQWLLQCGGPQAAADWARRQHGTASVTAPRQDSKTQPAKVVLKPGAADRAWDEDSDDDGAAVSAPEIPDDWEANDLDDIPVSKALAHVVAPVSQPEPPVAAEGPADAVLVFLPGLKEIQQLQELLVGLPEFACEPQRSWVLPLHSTVPPEEQRLVFQRPPPGIHKIVLSTNIAETAITIDDIGFVIDTGRMKENRYDPLRRMASLEDVLVSRANARQRRGRAGRVRPGAAIHLISSHRHNCVAAAQQAPEVQRVPLEQLVLQIKALQYPGTAADVCARLLEPPSPDAVKHAVTELTRLEALEVSGNREVLTPLGVHLSKLPVDVRIGKLLLLGAIFDVPDECLTIAAVLSCRSPFLSPFEKRDEADHARQQFNFGQSDHLSTLIAYMEWDSLGKGERRYGWARANFLGVKTLQMIASLKRQLLELLSEAGFVRPGLRSRAVESLGRMDGSDGCRIAIVEGVGRGGGYDECWRCGRTGHQARDCDQIPQSGGNDGRMIGLPGGPRGMSDLRGKEMVNVPLLQALLCAALYPQVMTVEYPKPKPGKKIKAESLKFRIREEGHEVPTEVVLHPSSINSKCTRFHSSYLVYHERVKTSRLYVRDCTPVSPYALMLFGGALTAEGADQSQQIRKGASRGPPVGDPVLSVDGWIKFSVPRGTQSLLLAVRESLDVLLKQKIEQPEIDLGGHREVIDAVVQLISTE